MIRVSEKKKKLPPRMTKPNAPLALPAMSLSPLFAAP